MSANVHAIVLIALPLATLLLISALKRRMPSRHQFVVALALASLGTLAAPVSARHMCLEGEPRNQWLILGPCLFLTLLLIDSKAWRRIIAGGVFVGMMGLSCHFSDLVHTPGWTGNPAWDGGQRVKFRSWQQAAAAAVSEMPDAEVVRPEGWLRELPIWPAIEKQLGDIRPLRREIRGAWHSPLTGLYQYITIPQDYWYPGGPLEDGISRIQLKDRDLAR